MTPGLAEASPGIAASPGATEEQAMPTVRVVLWNDMSREHTGGEKEFELEAKNLRAVIRAMDERFPGLGELLEEETTVAIDGEIHETAYFQPLREGAEIFFLPKIEAG